MATIENIVDTIASKVAKTGLAIPSVVALEVALSAAVDPAISPAVPPPPMIASDQETHGP
tara:strand:- start:10 stop:189 length:180 start_codon:yes stop_codon:yes gene_type:complete